MTRVAQRKILLLSSDDRLALAACRALGKGPNIVSILRLSEQKSYADYSQYCSGSYFLGAPGSTIQLFHRKLIKFLLVQRPDYLLPLGALADDIAYFNFSAVADVTRIIGPTPESRALSLNLISAQDIAKSVGLICPVVRNVPQSGSLPVETPLPCVVRAIVPSAILGDEWQSFGERTVKSRAELEAKLRDDRPRTELVLQAPISGASHALLCCAVDGSVLAAAVILRERKTKRHGWASLHTLPFGGVEREILETIARELRWTGFLTVNCRESDGRRIFERLDSRPDEALAVINFAGADFLNLTLGRLEGARLPDIATPHAGVCSRNLLLEMTWLWANRRSSGVGCLVRSTAQSLVKATQGREFLEVESAADPLPAVQQFGRVIKRLSSSIASPIWRTFYSFVERKAVAATISRDASLLIVCHGNINRSVVAEYLFRARGCARVSSAALLPVSGRCASAQAENFIAERLGFKIPDFRSQSIDRALGRNEEPHTILCFEHWHAVELVRRFPQLKGKVMLLSNLVGQQLWVRDIPDPHGADEQQYHSCFSLIDRIVSAANLSEGS